MTKPFGPQDFTYELPSGLIAQQPPDRRAASRLLHVVRGQGSLQGSLVDRTFGDLPALLRSGDLLVLNDTRVLPARFFATKPSGGKLDGLFIRQEADGAWLVMLRGAGRCKEGQRLALNEQYGLEIVRKLEGGQWLVRPEPFDTPREVLSHVGHTPLPPYIHRATPLPLGEGAPKGRVRLDQESTDIERYQTVYARVDGAVAAPTAGLHFTREMLSDLAGRGVGQAFVTLHVGPGTFQPVKAETLAEHVMHSEWYELPARTVDLIAQTKQRGGRVVAVGTTVVRVLESAARKCFGDIGDRPLSGGGLSPMSPMSGWTDLFLYPPADFAVIDALITNFHLPASTLLMLVAAFCSPGKVDGRERILATYRHAIAKGYRFYSYGDAMFIE